MRSIGARVECAGGGHGDVKTFNSFFDLEKTRTANLVSSVLLLARARVCQRDGRVGNRERRHVSRMVMIMTRFVMDR